MILKASTVGGAAGLGQHLLEGHENEEIFLHSVDGFMSDDPREALMEIEAAARGTRSDKAFFHLKLSPPQTENVSPTTYLKTLERVEKELKLEGQSRLLVFHSKNARTHAHAVYSRVQFDPETGKAKMHDCGLYADRLKSISRDTFIENGWNFPKGYMAGHAPDSRNYGIKEWKQAKRLNEDPRLLKATIQQCWAQSDDKRSFEHALRERGFKLCRGDRRGYVLVDYRMQPIALGRALNMNKKEMAERLGSEKNLPTLDQARAEVAAGMTKTLQGVIRKTEKRFRADRAPLDHKLDRMMKRHGEQRQKFNHKVSRIERQGAQRRKARLPKSFLGALFGLVTGRSSAIRKANKAEAEFEHKRVTTMRADFRHGLNSERLQLQNQYTSLAKQHHNERNELRRDVDFYLRQASPSRSETLKDHLRELQVAKKPVSEPSKSPAPSPAPKRDRGMDFD